MMAEDVMHVLLYRALTYPDLACNSLERNGSDQTGDTAQADGPRRIPNLAAGTT